MQTGCHLASPCTRMGQCQPNPPRSCSLICNRKGWKEAAHGRAWETGLLPGGGLGVGLPPKLLSGGEGPLYDMA